MLSGSRTRRTTGAVQASLFAEPVPARLSTAGAGIETRFDTAFVAELALREKQIQQNYRPVIAVHKWFARRPGSLFRALLLAEFASEELRQSYFTPQSLAGIRVADPFMGGGTPLLEANRLGCDVLGFDINPMAYWVVGQEIEQLDLDAYRRAAARVDEVLAREVGHLYHTRCVTCGRLDASAKYFLWVKTRPCEQCGVAIDLFPGYVVAKKGRHTAHVLVCASCGALTESASLDDPGTCNECATQLAVQGHASRGHCVCRGCGHANLYPHVDDGPPRHRMFAIEYHCDACQPHRPGRLFKRPDSHDLDRCGQAVRRLGKLGAGPLGDDRTPFIPGDLVPPGDETDRLHRWGYRRYRDMFNERQLLGLALICREVAATTDDRIRNALATNLSDLLRYQNMLCRYDTSSLKSLDIFSVHGFPVGLIQCESNLLGIRHSGVATNIGSGGWSNIVSKFARAKSYCERPFEVRHQGGRKLIVPMDGEWIGDRRNGNDGDPQRVVDLRCASATEAELPPGSLDAVFTDPPYFANVQYAELMDFCYVWLRQLVGDGDPAFSAPSTRNAAELTGNVTLARGLDHFTEGLSQVFQRMTRALNPGAPVAFTYHHNDIEAYYPVAVALLDAGLVCTSALAAPAEMGGSIHIHSTDSSVVDTVFVCRTTGSIPKRILVEDAEAVAALVVADLDHLREGGLKVTRGDARCVSFGHLIRLAVWRLRPTWDQAADWPEKLRHVGESVAGMGGPAAVEAQLPPEVINASRKAGAIREPPVPYDVSIEDAVSF